MVTYDIHGLVLRHLVISLLRTPFLKRKRKKSNKRQSLFSSRTMSPLNLLKKCPGPLGGIQREASVSGRSRLLPPTPKILPKPMLVLPRARTQRTLPSRNACQSSTKHNWLSACNEDLGACKEDRARQFQGFSSAYPYMHEHFAVNRCEGMALDKGGDTPKYNNGDTTTATQQSTAWCTPPCSGAFPLLFLSRLSLSLSLYMYIYLSLSLRLD